MEWIFVGLIIGAGLVYFFLRQQLASMRTDLRNALEAKARAEHEAQQLPDLKRELETTQAELRNALEAKARAEQDAQRLPELQQKLEESQKRCTQLQVDLASMTKALERETEKVQWVEIAEKKLGELFKALASDALDRNLQFSKSELQGIVNPLSTALKELQTHIHQIESERKGDVSSLKEQLRHLFDAHQQLQKITTGLESALKTPGVRGKWGEIQLHRIVELAGLQPYIDFIKQAPGEAGRPDMIIRLPNGGVVPLDAKAPMSAYLEAVNTTDERVRRQKLEDHARALRSHIKDLGSKSYWTQFGQTPDFVVMFLPSDSILITAFEYDHNLFEDAARQRVILTTPMTLLALLMTIAYGWRQHRAIEDAHEIVKRGIELYDRFCKFLEHLQKLGDQLNAAVEAYNKAIGSINERLLPAARALKDIGTGIKELPEISEIETQPRLFPREQRF